MGDISLANAGRSQASAAGKFNRSKVQEINLSAPTPCPCAFENASRSENPTR
jgi:hypothetical protein